MVKNNSNKGYFSVTDYLIIFTILLLIFYGISKLSNTDENDNFINSTIDSTIVDSVNFTVDSVFSLKDKIENNIKRIKVDSSGHTIIFNNEDGDSSMLILVFNYIPDKLANNKPSVCSDLSGNKVYYYIKSFKIDVLEKKMETKKDTNVTDSTELKKIQKEIKETEKKLEAAQRKIEKSKLSVKNEIKNIEIRYEIKKFLKHKVFDSSLKHTIIKHYDGSRYKINFYKKKRNNCEVWKDKNNRLVFYTIQRTK